MSTIGNSATGVNSSSAATAMTAAKGKTTMGKDDFLQLMITQMKNQDPLDPMDSSQYSAQLAQFSSLEQMTNINQTLTESLNAQYGLAQSINNSMSASMIGKEVKVSGSDIAVTKNLSSMEFGYNLEANAKTSVLKISDSDGKLVKTVDLSDLSMGDQKYTWDLTNSSGAKVAKGNYTYTIESKGNDGLEVATTAYRIGTIDAVRFTGSGTKAIIDGDEFDISDITEIMGGD